VNSSIVTRPVLRDDVKVIHIPASQLAHTAGLNSAANVVMLTAYLAVSGICRIQTLLDCIPVVFRKKEYLQLNLSLVRYMLEYMKTIDSV
jgi:Pyruvate/2-oxoacid:ferredoxin oxidoreductase gamma subunit